MKKLNKILLLVISLFSFTLINVNATTYTTNKKINFKEFNVPVDVSGLFNYKGDTYFYRTMTMDNLEMLVDGDKLSTKTSEYNIMLLDEMYSNHFTKNHYFDLDNNLVSAGFAISGEHRGNTFIELEDFEMDEVDIAQSFVDVDGYYNNKLYVSFDFRNSTAARINKYLAVYNDSKDTIDNVEYKLDKVFNFNNMIEPYFNDDKTYQLTYDANLETISTVMTEEPFIIARFTEWDNDNALYRVLVFDYDGKFIAEINDKNNIMEIVPVYSNENLKFAYITYEYITDNHQLKVTDGKNVETIINSEGYINVTNYNGLIVVDGGKNVIYDSEFNLIKEYEDVDYISVVKEETTLEETKAMRYNQNLYKEVQNGKYLVNLFTYGDYTQEIVKSELMTVEDSKKTSISGYIKDSNGNPLKGYIVELHSTPRTYTTDKDGYFKFDNVEEGEHTLIVKDSNGKVLATKELNVIEGTETKLDEDTLYFNPKDEGFNLNIKVDGDKLVVDSVDKGVKEPSKNIVEKLEEVVVPKTFDGIMAYILIFGILIGTTIYLNKKNRRIKYTNIK